MGNDNIWSVVIFKHGKYAVIEEGILSHTFSLSAVKRLKNEPKYKGCFIRTVKSSTVNNVGDKLTIDELLALKS